MATSPNATRVVPLVRARKQHFVQDLLKLQRAAQLINSTLDLDEIIHKIVKEVAASFGCIEAFVWLHDEATNEMVLEGVCGCTMYTECGHRLKVGEQGMIGHVAATGVTRYAPDVNVDQYYQGCEEGINSELDIPLKIGNKVIGCFQHGASRARRFSVRSASPARSSLRTHRSGRAERAHLSPRA